MNPVLISGKLRATTGALLFLLLTACQSGPSAPSQNITVSATKMIGIEATSSTSVRVTFDGALGDNQVELAVYALTSPSGAPLELVAAYAEVDGKNIDLATRPQQNVMYTLQLQGLRNASGTVLIGKASATGSVNPAPVLSSATPLSNTELLLTFSDPVTGAGVTLDDSATQPGNYRLSVSNTVAATAKLAPATLRTQSETLPVKSVRLNADRSSVILTSAAMPEGAIQVSAPGVLATTQTLQGKTALIDPIQSSVQFAAVGVPDRLKPFIARATSVSNTAVQVLFSEALTSDAADLTHYTIQDSSGAFLAVTDVRLSEFRTSALLTTAPQNASAEYKVTGTGLADMSGNPLDNSVGAQGFTGTSRQGPTAGDVTPPRVVNAGSTSNTQVVVSFSEAVRGGTDGAENPANYRIVGVPGVSSATLTPQTATVDVLIARLIKNGTAVELTTRAQSDVKYEVTVTNVTDLAGNQLAAPSTGVDPSRAAFIGTPPSGTLADTDKDGLSDAEELRGWTVPVTAVDGVTRKYEVTSDPTKADTDGDGLSDRDEKTNQTDPRDADTDDDQITDADEISVTFTNPANADSDHDTLSDGLEYTYFHTSPLLDDTDGDQIKDPVEILSNVRNPRIADLPIPDIRVGGVDMQLDVRFTATSETGRRDLESKSASSTLQESQSSTAAHSDASTTEWFTKAGATAGAQFDWGITNGGSKGNFHFDVSVEGGKSGSDTSTFTNSSTQEAQRSYQTTLNTDKEVTYNETVTRQVVNAAMAVGVNIQNAGTVTFTIKNLEITALMPDPVRIGSFVPVATLKAEGGGDSGITVAPGGYGRGPLRYKAVEVYPSMVERLMKSPEGLIFRISNYDMTDELGRNYAYVQQQVKERTADVVIDYSGTLPSERLSPATGVTFDAAGHPSGITMRSMMENLLGLKYHDVSEDSALSAEELHNSYSTKTVDGVDILWRVREKSKAGAVATAQQRWFLIHNNTFDDTKSFNKTVVKGGDTVRLAFNQDLDNDGLLLSDEILYGTSDNSKDSDGDGILDADEVKGPKDSTGQRHLPTLQLASGEVLTLHSNPNSADSDGDGLSDCQELQLKDSAGRAACPITPPGRSAYTSLLDPSQPDTDGDGINDRVELFGYPVLSKSTNSTITIYTNPISTDSDGDGLPDAIERQIGTNGGVSDRDVIADDDHDGLTNAEEKTPRVITFTGASGLPQTLSVTSDPLLSDTDGDGLRDRDEYLVKTNPRVGDTDGDALSDLEDLTAKTSPLLADTDGDGLSDGTEVKGSWLVSTVNPYQVSSNPLKADEDNDGLNDGVEKVNGTDPTKQDTDGDQSLDGFEIANKNYKLNPLLQDKLIELKLRSIRVDGSCDAGSTGDFRGSVGLKFGSSVFENLYDIGTSLDNTSEGSTLALNVSSNPRVIKAGDSISLATSGIYDYDASSANDPLSDGSTEVKYDQIQPTQNVPLSVTGGSSCGLTVNADLIWKNR